MSVDVAAARTFLRTHARIIEVRLAEVFLERTNDTAAFSAIDGIAAYRNSDGGFGHGLESDARAPDSQPLAVDSAFAVLADLVTDPAAGVDAVRDRAVQVVSETLPYLDSVADSSGGLSIVLPSVAAYPHAEHWGDGRFPPGLNPTGGIVATARHLLLSHPWLDRAAEFCRAAVTGAAGVRDAHTMLNALRFVESDPDQEWARKAYADLGAQFDELALFQPYPDAGYGLSPLHFAPEPDSPRRQFFDDDAVSAHLDALESNQLDDGGWALSWEPPGPAAELEWRGVETLRVLRVLQAYGRLG